MYCSRQHRSCGRQGEVELGVGWGETTSDICEAASAVDKGGVQSCSDLPVGKPPPFPFLFCPMFLSTHPHSLGSDMHVDSLKPPSISDGSLALVFPIHFAQDHVPVCENKGQRQGVWVRETGRENKWAPGVLVPSEGSW